MAFDFPATPGVGQQFSPTAGVTYVYNGYAWDLLGGPTASVTPTRIVPLTSGSGTYTVTPGTTFIQVEMVGGGGGGGGGANATPGSSGGNTTFGAFTASGGGGSNFTTPGVAGVGSGGQINLSGSQGGPSIPSLTGTWAGSGGIGGASYFGGNGSGANNAVGSSAAGNSGSGGGGGAANVTGTAASGLGGSSGGFCSAVIASPAASYSYSVGTAGVGATAGTNGFAGGAGGSGLIVVTEYGGSAAQAVTVPNIRTITASGTYTPSPGLVAAIVECLGGGGGGAGITGSGAYTIGGGGGGSGGYSRRLLTAAQIGASQTVTIGAAGTAGGATGNGGNAGDTSFGSFCIAKGGVGGVGQTIGAYLIGGGGGSVTGAVGDIVAAGAAGYPGGQSAAGDVLSGGAGGSAAFGGGGNGGPWVASTSQNGFAGSNYGSGGGGGCVNNSATGCSGGAGSPGVCIVTEFIQQGGAAAAALPGARVLIQTQTVSSAVASVNFTSGLDSTYDEYELHVVGLIGSAGNYVMLRVSSNGGLSWDQGAADYYFGARISYASTASADLNSPSGTTSIQFALVGGAASISTSSIIQFQQPTSATYHSFRFNSDGHHATNGVNSIVGAGWRASATAFNALQILNASGNITAGTFNLYGIKK